MNVIDPGVLLQHALAGELHDDDREGCARQIPHLIGRQIVQRMGRDEQRQVVELQILCGEPSVREKRR